MFKTIRNLLLVLCVASSAAACQSSGSTSLKPDLSAPPSIQTTQASLTAGESGKLTCYDNNVTSFGEIRVKVLSAREAGQTGSCDGYELPASSITKKAVEDGGFVVYRHGKAYFNPFTMENGVYVVNPWSKRDLSAV